MSIEIALTKGFVAIVDEADKDLAQYNWRLSASSRHNKVYARRSIGGRLDEKTVYMHRIILERILGRELDASELVDHVHGNGIDNRRSELRIASSVQNAQNKIIQSHSRNPYKGLSLKNGEWFSYITYDKKLHYIGKFDTPLDAHRAYCIAALKHFGEFANFGENSPFKGWALADFD